MTYPFQPPITRGSPSHTIKADATNHYFHVYIKSHMGGFGRRSIPYRSLFMHRAETPHCRLCDHDCGDADDILLHCPFFSCIRAQRLAQPHSFTARPQSIPVEPIGVTPVLTTKVSPVRPTQSRCSGTVWACTYHSQTSAEV